jgi:hypothetical protein
MCEDNIRFELTISHLTPEEEKWLTENADHAPTPEDFATLISMGVRHFFHWKEKDDVLVGPKGRRWTAYSADVIDFPGFINFLQDYLVACRQECSIELRYIDQCTEAKWEHVGKGIVKITADYALIVPFERSESSVNREAALGALPCRND